MKECKDNWHQSLPHTPMLRFKFLELDFCGPEEYLFDRLSSDHDGQFRGHMKPMPDAANIVQVDIDRISRYGVKPY